MAFMDNLGNMAKNLCDKASGTAETVKLNARVSTERWAIEDLTRKLGAAQGEAETEFCRGIDEHNTAVAGLQAELKKLKQGGQSPAALSCNKRSQIVQEEVNTVKKKLLTLALAALLALALAACDGGGTDRGAAADFPSGLQAGSSEQTTSKTDAQSGLTLEKLKQRATDLGLEISDLTSMQKGAYLNIADGFNVTITEDSYEPVYEMASAADAEDAAQKESAAGYNISFVSGKFYACVGKDDAAAQSGMSELMGVAPSKPNGMPDTPATGGVTAAEGGKLSPPDWLIGTWEGDEVTNGEIIEATAGNVSVSSGNLDFSFQIKEAGLNIAESEEDGVYRLEYDISGTKMSYLFEPQDDGTMKRTVIMDGGGEVSSIFTKK
jgi:hypothetical protein